MGGRGRPEVAPGERLKIALDTNRYVDFIAGAQGAVTVIESAGEVVVPFVVLAELHGGFRSGNKRAQNEKALNAFLGRAGVRAAYPDEGTIDVYADLAADLRRRGRNMPNNDVWIAAICVQHSLRLYTRDAHFDELPQVLRA